MKVNNKEVEKYFQSIPKARIDRMYKIHSMILDIYPNADVTMKYKMPTYHVCDGWVSLANQKNYISLYTCGYHHSEQFKSKYLKIKTGTGCINFRDKYEIPLSDLKQVIKHAIEHPKAGL